ncbi:MAG: alkaline phosphatase family protein [Acidobacteria bacterium]|nr:alkaline phosphatase family protein [Acidobacteriota bacterium]
MKQKNNFQRLATVVLVLTFAFSSFTSGQTVRPKKKAATNAKPKLVVLIVIDQFRYDFLERFEDLFGVGGFKRLINNGAFFTNANYDYVPTYTAPGHAAIATGSVPAQNGIVGNTWFDRDLGKVRVMVSDLKAKNVTMTGVQTQVGAPSPRALIGTTLGDQMRLATNQQAKVIAISQKDRGAVLPGGQHPNGVFWYQSSDGTYISSDYYFQTLPAWVQTFNTKNRPDKYFGKKWEHLLPDAAYARTQKDYTPLQKTALGDKFPYTLTGGEEKPGTKFYNLFELTPFATEHLAALAKAAITAEALGADDFTDFLSVSFSAPDLIGHAYGPDSAEVLDTYVRLDQVVADLLNFIDAKVGLTNTVIALTGDHGVSPVPEYLAKLGYDAARVPTQALIEAVNKALNERYNKNEKWVQSFVNDQLYLDQKLLAAVKADAEEVEKIAGDAALKTPGVVNYFTRSQILEGDLPNTALARRVTNGFNRARSGDVWVIIKPFSFFTEGSIATTHGSPYNYDTHVPVIFFGKGIQKGRFSMECSPSDIAPTLASLLRIELPSNRYGRVLPLADK